MTKQAVSEARLKAVDIVINNWFAMSHNNIIIKNRLLKNLSVKQWKKRDDGYTNHEHQLQFLNICYDEMLFAKKLEFTDKIWEQIAKDSCVYEYVPDFKLKQKRLKGELVDDKKFEKISYLNGYLAKVIPFRRADQYHANNETIRIEKKQNGIAKKTRIEMQKMQLEDLKFGGVDSDELSLADNLDNNNKLYSSHDDYFHSHFYYWWSRNADRIIDKRTIPFLELYKQAYHYNTNSAELAEATNTPQEKVGAKIKRISQRIVNAYNEEKPKMYSEYHMQLIRFNDLVDELDKLDDAARFEYVADHFEYLQEYVKLKLTEHQAVNRRQYNKLLMRKIYKQLNDIKKIHIERLSQVKTMSDDVNDIKSISLLAQPFENVEFGVKRAKIISMDGVIATVRDDTKKESEVKTYKY